MTLVFSTIPITRIVKKQSRPEAAHATRPGRARLHKVRKPLCGSTPNCRDPQRGFGPSFLGSGVRAGDCELGFQSVDLLTGSRKEVIQPQVPLRLPCYDFAPVTELAFGRSLLAVRTRTSGTPGFHGVTGGVYKARERIHRGVADPRLLAIPASCGRVAARNPNLDQVSGIRSALRPCSPLSWPL